MTLYNDQMVAHDGSTDVHYYYPRYPHQSSLSSTGPSAVVSPSSTGIDYAPKTDAYDPALVNSDRPTLAKAASPKASLDTGPILPLGPEATELVKEVTRLRLLSQSAVSRLAKTQQQLNAVTTEINHLAIQRSSILIQKAESAVECARWDHNQKRAFARIEDLVGQTQHSATAPQEYDLLTENLEMLQTILLRERLLMGIVTQREILAVSGVYSIRYVSKLIRFQSSSMQKLAGQEAELQEKLKGLREEVVSLSL